MRFVLFLSLFPILLTVLALIGVLILWGYLCKKEARRKAEQPDGQEAVSGIALQPEHDTNNEPAHPTLATRTMPTKKKSSAAASRLT